MAPLPATSARGLAIGILHADPRDQELSLSGRLLSLGARVDLLDVRDLEAETSYWYDCVLNRVYPSTIFDKPKAVLDRTVDIVKQLEQNGVFVLSGTLSTLADYSKLLASQLMISQSVRTPLTVALTADMAEAAPPFLPAVVKPDIGAFGRDCVKLDSIDDWHFHLESSDWRMRPRVVQKYVRPSTGVDYRVTVMFGEVVFAYQRVLVDGWVGNNRGPSLISPATDTIPKEALEMAVRSSRAIGALANGVDLIVDDQGATIIENNPTLGFSPKSWKIDVFAERIYQFLLRRARVQESGRVDY